MGKDWDRKHRRRQKSSETSSSSSTSISDIESPGEKRRRPQQNGKLSEHREKSRHRMREDDITRKSRKMKKRQRKKLRSGAEDNSSSSGGDFHRLKNREPYAILYQILDKFPDVANDLLQLMQLIDSGQGVNIKGISDKSFVGLLKKLFFSLNLKENGKGVFSLPYMTMSTLELIGSILLSHLKSRQDHSAVSEPERQQNIPCGSESTENRHTYDPKLAEQQENVEYLVPPKRRIIGPEMPSCELLAAAAELTRAEAEFRDADLKADNDLFIGPPPPAMVAEVESTNEAERFEEVERIVSAEVAKPYDVLGTNWKASFDNIKKRYWKLSLMVHPDKCAHPQSHQAFVTLNQAFKDLQDPEKRKVIDEKIKLKEKQEAFQAELKSLREAAQWRRLQGVSLEGDDELLAFPKEEPKVERDEWMTKLPPERKPGMPVQSTSFSKSGKEARGDASMWTDTPLDKSRQAKQNYLEAYNKTKELADTDEQRKSKSSDANLVDEYNSAKRSKSLVQKHLDESRHPKKKSKVPEQEGWAGMHPWKPWDREKDLAAGRQNVNLDSAGMAQGLTSRFSAGPTQRNFL
ncbi:hypothetical protein KSP40_PGU017413 [Platanthera guangdongensis]|uniref:J domain-containing protein n=1 Tax=Platanthera guangdongensis TaxID=2320717 RepID=A0ABR2M5X8_9ASPA